MGFAVTRELEIIFGTVKTSRKCANSKKNPAVAWVIGCTMEVAVQYEGSARDLEGEELAKATVRRLFRYRGESILAEASYAACSVFRKSKLGSILRRSFCGERSRLPIGIQLIPSSAASDVYKRQQRIPSERLWLPVIADRCQHG